MTCEEDFQRVFERPLRVSHGGLTTLARRNDFGYARLGLAISRKCAGTSVTRNRIKRLVRESFRHHQHRLGALDVVVLGRSGVAQLGNDAVRDTLEQHWTALIERCKDC